LNQDTEFRKRHQRNEQELLSEILAYLNGKEHGALKTEIMYACNLNGKAFTKLVGSLVREDHVCTKTGFGITAYRITEKGKSALPTLEKSIELVKEVVR